MSRLKKILCLLLALAVCTAAVPFLTHQSAGSSFVSLWTKYEQNPVLVNGPFSGEASVIYDSAAGLYKMWYTRAPDNAGALDSLISNLLEAAGGDLVSVLKTFNRAGIAANSYAVKSAISHLARLSEDEIRSALLSATPSIAYAVSTDGITWDLRPENVFSGGAGSWDAYGASSPSVIKTGPSSYEMWYTGWKYDIEAVRKLFSDLDKLDAEGLNFLLVDLLIEKDISRLLDHLKTVTPEGSEYPVNLLRDIKAALEGSGGTIGRVVSTNGINWTGAAAVLQRDTDVKPSAWDIHGVYYPSVIKTSTGYTMWYTGLKIDFSPFLALLEGGATRVDLEKALAGSVYLQTGRAVSTRGTSWTKTAAPVMPRGFGSLTGEADGELRGIIDPEVIFDGGSYHMWYTSVTAFPAPLLDFVKGVCSFDAAVEQATGFSIGYAVSGNGTSWTPSGTALTKSTGPAWDKNGVLAPAVIRRGTEVMVWYTGVSTASPAALVTGLLDGSGLAASLANSGTRSAICLATTEFTPPPPPDWGSTETPPVSVPPVTTPPVTVPPTSVRPTTPPVTVPPTTIPPTTGPPVTVPPTSVRPVTAPPSTTPPEVEPVRTLKSPIWPLIVLIVCSAFIIVVVVALIIRRRSMS